MHTMSTFCARSTQVHTCAMSERLRQLSASALAITPALRTPTAELNITSAQATRARYQSVHAASQSLMLCAFLKCWTGCWRPLRPSHAGIAFTCMHDLACDGMVRGVAQGYCLSANVSTSCAARCSSIELTTTCSSACASRRLQYRRTADYSSTLIIRKLLQTGKYSHSLLE